MICAGCHSPLQDIDGAVPLQNCSHIVCLDCLTELVLHTKRSSISCPSNIGKRKKSCHGFLDEDDIKWAVSAEVYEEYCNKGHSDPLDNQKPTTSKNTQEYNSVATPHFRVDDVDDDGQFDGEEPSEEYEIVELVTFDELELSEAEKQSGWGQMATYINNLMMNENMSYSQATRHVDVQPVWITRLKTTCPICFEEIPPQQGIILKDCFHMFCRACITQYIESSTTAEVQCPFSDGEYFCTSHLKPNELKSLVSKEIYDEHYEVLSLQEAEKALPNVFHCRTPNCGGFCTYDDDLEVGGTMIFQCPKCSARNCIPCKVIHEQSCVEYWQQIEDEENRLREMERQDIERKERAESDERNRLEQRRNEQLSESMINAQLGQRIFMRCPKCNIPCYKFTGCNHVTCTSCKHGFNWTGLDPGPLGCR